MTSVTRKRVLAGLIALTAVLSLSGLAVWQRYFSVETAETSASSIYDVWNGDPRQTCTPFQAEGGGTGWKCTPNPGVTDGTIRYHAGKCDGSDDYDHVLLDLPIKQIDATERQLEGNNRPWPGNILVTYRPKVFGFIGRNRVLKVEVMPEGSTCGNGSGY